LPREPNLETGVPLAVEDQLFVKLSR
jgi:hypothetical protein